MTNSPTLRNEYLVQENLRAKASPSLAERFPNLKSLTVDLGYFDVERAGRSKQIKYMPKLGFARSIFRVGCQNEECVRGDFDLSAVLANAVAARRTSVSGELTCQGWRSEALIDSVPCGRILRYTLTLSY